MIKVNLLRDQTDRVRKITVKPTISGIGLLLAVVAVLATAAMGAWWYTVSPPDHHPHRRARPAPHRK